MTKKIAVLPGDGIGPEVMESAMQVLNAIAEKYGHQFSFVEGLIGGAAYDVHGQHLPKETLVLVQNSDAVLFGAVGGPVDQQDQPKWQGAERNALLGIRKFFNFNINVRPAIVWPSLVNKSVLKSEIIGDGFDLVIVRELSGGLYFGKHETTEKNGLREAIDIMHYDEETIRKVVTLAFETALLRGRKLCSVDKANVLDCSILWRKIVEEVAQNFPEVSVTHMYVDNAAMQLVKNPRFFDVIVTENMFGDILSDLSSVLPGSLGLLGSASFNEQGFGFYEPSGGSAPDIAGQGLANPIGMLLSAAMMLKYSFKLEKEALAVENAIQKAVETARTGDIWQEGYTKVNTSQFTEEVMKNL